MSTQNGIAIPYENLLAEILQTGVHRGDRTGTGTLSLLGKQLSYDLSKGFPLLTTKHVPFRLIAAELIWFLRGDTNIRYLLEHNVHIWSEWPYKKYLQKTGQEVPPSSSMKWKDGLKAFERLILDDDAFAERYGSVGRVYGAQWRAWRTSSGGSIDQIATVLESIKSDPEGRRHIVTAWDPESVRDDSLLPPCHMVFQFYVAEGKLSCHLLQRSADMFLGVPFNIASYALLTAIIAKHTGLELGELVMTFVDAHIYSNHVNQVAQQLGNLPYPYPTLRFERVREDISDYEVSDFVIEDYESHGRIPAPIAV